MQKPLIVYVDYADVHMYPAGLAVLLVWVFNFSITSIYECEQRRLLWVCAFVAQQCDNCQNPFNYKTGGKNKTWMAVPQGGGGNTPIISYIVGFAHFLGSKFWISIFWVGGFKNEYFWGYENCLYNVRGEVISKLDYLGCLCKTGLFWGSFLCILGS